MKLTWSGRAREQYEYWARADRHVHARINALVADIERAPYQGLGKPEPLRYELAGFWSRRITKEHRLVYRVTAGGIEIVQCRFHYKA
jgi:toxin YoeB